MEMHHGKFGKMEKKINIEEIFKNKTILVTGHTGFIGTWMSLWLYMLGAKIIGYSQKPPTKPSIFEIIKIKKDITHTSGNVNNFHNLQKVVKIHKPEFVFHLAAESIVRESYEHPLITLQTNVMGTANVLEAIKNSSVKSCVMMTSDKCYENKEFGRVFNENDPMGGNDPYSASKGAAELIIASYQKSFFGNKNNETGIASVRAGNVIGGGDWAKDRLLPDCFRALNSRKKISIRNPNSIRPWQFVLEPISGMLHLAENLRKNPKQFSEPWNFGPSLSSKRYTVDEIVKKVIGIWGKNNVIAYDKKNNVKLHEAKSLMLNSTKAKKYLNWKSVYSNNESIFETTEWYKNYFNKNNMRDFTMKQIQQYMKKLNGIR